MGNMRVAVIGAGMAGLCAARHVLDDEGMTCVVYERTSMLGGTWIYTGDTGFDEFGLPIHTSMYKSLRTNLPKELMGFPDFPIPCHPKSFIPGPDILNFLNLYAEEFNLLHHIKFNHFVELVRPTSDDKWEVTVRNLSEGRSVTEIYDAIMVCNGHFHKPRIPDIKNKELFKGRQLHSHDYRVPDAFADSRVLIIGAGPSGRDIALEIAKVAKHVTLSHHMKTVPSTRFPPQLTMRNSDVRELTPTGAIFKDDHEQNYDIVLYCTGYLYTFPFLSPECGISVRDNYVQPLYKHIINISRPTMALIGLPFYVCPAQMIDIQARFFTKMLKGKLQLPSEAEMRDDTERDMQRRWANGFTTRQAHMMGPEQEKYYSDLATTADLKPIAPVMIKMYNVNRERLFDAGDKFRDDLYRVIDDSNFECIYKD